VQERFHVVRALHFERVGEVREEAVGQRHHSVAGRRPSHGPRRRDLARMLKYA
jgi:hypothetical protein